jgi:hypothetical protein
MSVSIDTVYQRVLSILNKEQRGYITPQTFNLFANQAQMEIFEKYFYDLDKFHRTIPRNGHVNANIPALIEEKISLFEKTSVVSISTDHYLLPEDLYRLNNIFVESSDNEAEPVSSQYLLKLNKSDLTAPSERWPVYVQSDTKIDLFPKTINQDITLYYIKKPVKVEWKYRIVFGEALYDASNSVDFELHDSEETKLVIKILGLAGLEVKDVNLYQVAAGEEIKDEQIKKS